MTSTLHAVSNFKLNLWHDIQWGWQTKITKPWLDMHSRQYQLDAWHKKQKQKFKELFTVAFKEEQEELLPHRRYDLRAQMEADGKSEKEIKKAVNKLKVQSFDEEKSEVTIQRFLKFIREFREAEKMKSAKLKNDKLDHNLIFVRNNREIRIFDQHPFFKSQNPTETIRWGQFKTDVFYQYVNWRNGYLDAVQREKRIVKTIDLSWAQLRSENSGKDITYDMLKKRLQSFTHAIDAKFFEQSFWLEKGDQVLKDIEEFKREDCDIKMSDADVYQMIKDLRNEQATEYTEVDVKLGKEAVTSETKKSQSEPSSPVSKAGGGFFSRLLSSSKKSQTSTPDVTAGAGSASTSTVVSASNTPSVSKSASSTNNDDPTSAANLVDEVELKEEIGSIIENATIDSSSPPTVVSEVIVVAENEEDNEEEEEEDDMDEEEDDKTLTFDEILDVLNNELLEQLLSADLITADGQDILSKVQKTLDAGGDSPSASSIQMLVLSAQNQVDQISENLNQILADVRQEAKSKTTGFRAHLSKASTIEKLKKEYEVKIGVALERRDAFDADAQKIMEYLRYRYRSALARTRPIGRPQDDSNEDILSWKEMIEEDRTDVLITETSKSSGVSKQVSIAVVSTTLESVDSFERKFKEVKAQFVVYDAPSEVERLPTCVDYSSELPPCEAQDPSHPACIEAIVLLKQWQEYKNYALREKLSIDYLIDTLDAKHDKNPKAVNLCVDACVWDALALLKSRGIPTAQDYAKFCDRSKSKTAQWIREHNARFKVACRRHMFDRILLIRDIAHIQLALARYGPVLCSAPFWSPQKVNFWKKSSDEAQLKGYHTLLLVGYDQQNGGTLLFRNTSGPDYGDYGYIRLSFKAFQESQMVAILCVDDTKPKFAGRVDHSALLELVTSTSVANEVKATEPEQVLVEDSLIRDAKKIAADFINSRGGIFQSAVFDNVGFKFPPIVDAYTLLVPGQTGVACIGFASTQAIVPWDPNTTGYYIFVNQTTSYISGPNNELFQLTLLTDNRTKWTQMQGSRLMTSAANLIIKDANGLVVFQENVLLSVDITQTFVPRTMKISLS